MEIAVDDRQSAYAFNGFEKPMHAMLSARFPRCSKPTIDRTTEAHQRGSEVDLGQYLSSSF
jgi:hypothetical protein